MALLNDKSLHGLVKEMKDEHAKMLTLTVSAVFCDVHPLAEYF
jgi:hypothetical protein